VNDTRKYLEYDEDDERLEDYRKPVKVGKKQRPSDKSAGFGVTQGVFKKESAKIRGGGR